MKMTKMNKGNEMGKRRSIAASTSRVLRSASGGNNHFINQPRYNSYLLSFNTNQINISLQTVHILYQLINIQCQSLRSFNSRTKIKRKVKERRTLPHEVMGLWIL